MNKPEVKCSNHSVKLIIISLLDTLKEVCSELFPCFHPRKPTRNLNITHLKRRNIFHPPRSCWILKNVSFRGVVRNVWSFPNLVFILEPQPRWDSNLQKNDQNKAWSEYLRSRV